MKYNGLDVYDITLQKNDIGISATSLVTLPAMESQFLYFNKDKPQFMFSDEEKGELIGAFMIPDKLIYRDVGGYKFYVNFTKEVISDLVKVRNITSYLRDLVACIPNKFVGVATTKCN